MHTAFIGTGTMGAPMALRLLDAGRKVHFLRRKESDNARQVIERGGVPFATAAEAISGATTVILMLPDEKVVAEVLSDVDVQSALKPGMLVIDCSTSNPISTRRLAASLDERSVEFCDAPVVRGVTGARNGTLAFYMGGSDTAVPRAHEALAPCGSDFLHVGAAGAGHTAKALNNAVSLSTLALLSKAFQLARKEGLNLERYFDALALSNADSASLRQFRPVLLGGRRPEIAFRLRLALKDLKLTEAIAETTGDEIGIIGETIKVLQEGVDRGLGDCDLTEIVHMERE